MKNVDETLEERGEVYGDYEGGTLFRARVMDLITARHLEVHDEAMTTYQEIQIFDLVNKISRLAVTPKHVDSWHDIAGYAKLTEETLIKDNDE